MQELLLPGECVEELVAERLGGAARIRHLLAEVVDGVRAFDDLARVCLEAALELREDVADAREGVVAERLQQERRAILVRHRVEFRGEVGDDVEERPEPSRRVGSRDPDAVQGRLRARIGHPLHRHRHAARGALDAGDDVVDQAEGDERLVERLVQDVRAVGGVTEGER